MEMQEIFSWNQCDPKEHAASRVASPATPDAGMRRRSSSKKFTRKVTRTELFSGLAGSFAARTAKRLPSGARSRFDRPGIHLHDPAVRSRVKDRFCALPDKQSIGNCCQCGYTQETENAFHADAECESDR